jgi:DNA-directed RNA polymerase subunit RPC12/RpoP
MNDDAQDILVRGIAAAKAREPEEAQRYLEWALRLEPDPDQAQEAWYWLSQVTTNPAEKRNWLENILSHNPGDGRARRALAILDGRLNPAEIIDPDRFSNPPSGIPQTGEAQRFICPNCGGRMTFTPDGLSLTCEYCAVHEHINSNKKPSASEDFLIAMATAKGHNTPTQAFALVCEGCGANFLLPPQDLTIKCPYCQSTYILKSQFHRNLVPPSAIIPLSVSEEQAQYALHQWLDEKHLPTPVQVFKGIGIYLPFWEFDIGGQIEWRYQIQITPATKRLSKRCLSVMKSYDLSSLVDYDPRLLANWPAETYQVEVGNASLDARLIALEEFKMKVQSRIPSAVNNVVFDSSNMLVDSFTLILLPLWMTRLIWDKDHQVEVVINGQSAQVFSDLS